MAKEIVRVHFMFDDVRMDIGGEFVLVDALEVAWQLDGMDKLIEYQKTERFKELCKELAVKYCVDEMELVITDDEPLHTYAGDDEQGEWMHEDLVEDFVVWRNESMKGNIKGMVWFIKEYRKNNGVMTKEMIAYADGEVY